MHERHCRVCRALRRPLIARRLIDALFCALIADNYTCDEWAALLSLAAQMDAA